MAWMDYDECTFFSRCVMIPNRSQQKLRIGRFVGRSPQVLNFKVFVTSLPTTWGPQECCLLLRKYAAIVVWFKCEKMLKVRSNWKLWFQQQPTLGSECFITTVVCKNRRFSLIVEARRFSAIQRGLGRPRPLPSARNKFKKTGRLQKPAHATKLWNLAPDVRLSLAVKGSYTLLPQRGRNRVFVTLDWRSPEWPKLHVAGMG